jgi:hypothetical protein
MWIHRTAYDDDDDDDDDDPLPLLVTVCRVTWGNMIRFANFIFLYVFRTEFRSHFMLI